MIGSIEFGRKAEGELPRGNVLRVDIRGFASSVSLGGRG